MPRSPGVLLRELRFRDALLVVAVNASSSPVEVPVEGCSDRDGEPLPALSLSAGEARLFLFDKNFRLLDRIAGSDR